MAIRLLSGETIDGGVTVTGGVTVNDTLNSVLELNTSNANCDITMQSVNTSSLTRLRNGTNDFQVHTNGTLGLTIDSSQNATFAGDINIAAAKKLKFNSNSFMTPENNTSGAEISTAGTFIVKTGSTPTLGLTIDASQNATFAGKITAPTLSIQNQINTTSSNLEINYANGDGTTTNFKDFYVRDGKNAIILNIQGSSKNATFAGNVTFSGNVTTTGDVQADQFISTNNGNGQNYRIGDDAWIGDINVANTFRISGNQNPNNGYITFGNSSNDALGRAGTGPLTWGSSFKIADEKILGLRISSDDYAIQYRDLDFRLIGSADGTTQRNFSFGHYTSDNLAGS
jgi:hypothetical protein